MEPGRGRRSKKLIWAIEADRMHGRPSCSECNDALQRQRGCFKPGNAIEGRQAFRFASPMLDAKDRILRECPVGRVLREAPQTYQVLRAASHGTEGGPQVLRESRYFQQVAAIVASERARLSELEHAQRQAGGDAAHAARVLRRG